MMLSLQSIQNHEVEILPVPSKAERISKITLLFVSTGVGFVIAYPGTIPNWTKPKIIVTNIGVILAFGTLGTWGLFMSGYKAGESLAQIRDVSCLKVGAKVAQIAVSVVVGAFAQLPIYEIAEKFNGPSWALATELGGMWVPAYSQYALIEKIKELVQTSRGCSSNAMEDMRQMLLFRIENVFSNVKKNLRLAKDLEIQSAYEKWSRLFLIPKAEEKVTALFRCVTELSQELCQEPPKRNRCSLAIRTGLQVSTLTMTSLYFLQNYMLPKEFWQDKTDSEETSSVLSVLSIAPLSFYVLKGAWVSMGHIYDMVGDLFNHTRDPSFQEVHFKLSSRLLYFCSLGIALLPQLQTAKIADDTYDSHTSFGATFLSSNVLSTVLFIYITMKELIDVVLIESIDQGFVQDIKIRTARRLEKELTEAINYLKKQPLEVLLQLLDDIPQDEIKRNFIEKIEEEKLKELMPILTSTKKENFDRYLSL